MKRCKAFTLVELLVVIAIIALLLSILMPTLSRVRISSQRVVCLSNVRQIALATTVYANANQGKTMYVFGDPGAPGTPDGYFETYPPLLRFPGTNGSGGVAGIGYLIQSGYLALKVVYCPMAKTFSYKNCAPTWQSGTGYTWSSYGMHYATRLESKPVALVADYFFYPYMPPEHFNHNYGQKIDEFSVSFSDCSAKLLKDPSRIIRLQNTTWTRTQVYDTWDSIFTRSMNSNFLILRR